MSCSPFKVSFSGSAADLFSKIEKLIKQHGGTISGDDANGKFEIPVGVLGHVDGTYSISGQECTITITHKSFLLACSKIEAYVKEHMPRVAAASIEEI